MGTPSGPASTSSLSAGSGSTGLTPLSLIQKQTKQSTRRSTLWTRKRATQALVRNCRLQQRREVVKAGAHPGCVGGGEETVDGEDPRAHVHLEVPAPEVGRDLDDEQQRREGDPGPSVSSRRGEAAARAPREDRAARGPRNERSLALQQRRFWPYLMGLDEMGTLHERGLAQIFVQATKHTGVSKTCIQRSLYKRIQATNQPVSVSTLENALNSFPSMWV
ncbi:hypothetical protein ZEAMMB73_Zm00001d025282 [Zea mays]|uniref:Uncharacterized protein n=1 Tax=Zea mays TaxID=4577 RepID=K7TSX9_MAIZE|nr:hypothetical protein ZEAMMB73_Zm00001d025282 [Zea mays]